MPAHSGGSFDQELKGTNGGNADRVFNYAATRGLRLASDYPTRGPPVQVHPCQADNTVLPNQLAPGVVTCAGIVDLTTPSDLENVGGGVAGMNGG